jgi:hypothetical protein
MKTICASPLLIGTLGGAFSVFFSLCAPAQEGQHGVGHAKWHRNFYSTLKRPDGAGPCCSDGDCRPTASQTVGDHYEVKVDGLWLPVPREAIVNVIAPDGGAHVCAPSSEGRAYTRGVVYCVILPPDS